VYITERCILPCEVRESRYPAIPGFTGGILIFTVYACAGRIMTG
jgi:hypothetical protein